MSTDPTFDEEQRRLSETYAKLQDIEADLTAKLNMLSTEAAEDIAAMRDELAFDFAESDHTFDTFTEYELMNKVIDAYNLSNDINKEKLTRTLMLLQRPYFAKVTLQFKPDAAPRDIYLGAAGMTDEKRRHFIIDWRSPVAEVYYNQENGPTQYVADGRVITCDLQLRRQFDLDRNVLHSYFDTTVAIEDPLLLKALRKRRSDKLQAITTTIQREQNRVIRHADVPVLLVNGIAGSGKTSVLLQRIAYLLYTYRDTLDARNVCLITPNPVFQRYIDKVLPEMGERNPQTLTWEQLMGRLGQGDAGADGTVSVEDLRAIDARLEGFTFEDDDFCDIMAGNVRAVSAQQARSVANSLAHLKPGPRFCSLVGEQLRDKLENKMASLASSDAVHGDMMELPVDEQIRLFGYRIFPQSEEEFQQLAKTYLAAKFAPAFDAIESAGWLRLNRIGMRLLGKENLSPTEWIYLKLALTNQGNSNVQFVMLDEVQDYTLAQLMMLQRYFSNAHFLLLGDENQAVKPGTASFADIKALFAARLGAENVEECRLMTSYRSSPEITALFAGLLDATARIDITSVQREGEAPVVVACEPAAYEDTLRQHVVAAREREGLSAVICSSKKVARRLAQALGEDAPQLLAENAALPAQGVVMMHLELAKGLEFDSVIVPDAQADNYPDTPLARRRLYTALSRATQHATVLSCGEMTPLL
ncbi:MAG: AAA family ATPase [Coriobacteriia bacterium]|nr:AAA family ATPase [Coriobacteriia bacterium]